MRRPLTATLTAWLLFAAGPAPSAEAAPVAGSRTQARVAIERFTGLMARSPEAPPGFVVAVVDRDGLVFAHAYGVRDLASRAPLTLDTPIYTSSTTKAWVGLLAAQLDADGTMPLTASLADIWPGLTLKPPADARRIIASALLSHSSGFYDAGVNWRSNVAGNLTLADIPGHLQTWGESGPTTFHYSNFGPYLWSMMVQQRTGRDWRVALERKVFGPLGLTRTGMRLDRYRPGEIGHCNARVAGDWRTMPPKPQALLNAGGGVFTTGSDAARFLRAFLTGGHSAGGRIPPAVLARTWRQEAVQTNDFFGLRRDGYGLGWDLGTYGGRRFVSRSGGSSGCRSILAFQPESGVGVAVLTLGDAGGNTLNTSIVKQVFDLWNDPAAAAAAEPERIASFAVDAAKAKQQVDAATAAPAPSGPPPSARSLTELAGDYDSPRLGMMRVSVARSGLVGDLGLFHLTLVPQGADAFVGVDASFEAEPESFRFERDAGGRPTALLWGSRRFERVG
jgi:CubicO group peptidase (beta-lactamase class C family)